MAGTVRFLTFGCKANQYDTQVLREALLRHGWDEGAAGPDLVVMNTCTVTAEAGRRARQLVRRLARETPDVRILVTGCLAESEAERLHQLPNVAHVIGNGEAKQPVQFLRRIGIEVEEDELDLPPGITEFTGHTRAFLKIQDGCDMACAFCIIPSVRGPARSRSVLDLESEVARLLASGHREIVLTGIHIGHWGRDLGLDLAHLVGSLARVEARDERGHPIDWRLRLSSIEATEVTDALLDVMTDHPRRIAPHLHMPLQSGDDGVLAAMNRWYDVETYLASCERIRAALDRPAFTADVLVGFPGEDDRAFENTLETARRAGFSRIHVFPFSPRPGTAAGAPGFGPAVEAPVKRARRAALVALAKRLAASFRSELDGARDVLALEGAVGLSGRYERVQLMKDGEGGTTCEGPPAAGLVDVELSLETVVAAHAGEESGPRLRGRPLAGHPA